MQETGFFPLKKFGLMLTVHWRSLMAAHAHERCRGTDNSYPSPATWDPRSDCIERSSLTLASELEHPLQPTCRRLSSASPSYQMRSRDAARFSPITSPRIAWRWLHSMLMGWQNSPYLPQMRSHTKLDS